MAGQNHFREIKIVRLYSEKKNGSRRFNIVSYLGSQSLMSFYFTKIFVHL